MKTLLLTIAFLLFSNTGLADQVYIFSASWCKPCKSLKSFLLQNPKLVEGHSVSTIDIDDYPELKEKFNIIAVPTTVIMRDNKEQVRIRGFNSSVWGSWIKRNLSN